MLSIKDLKVAIDGKEIISGLNLDVKAGEVHAIMGPNGTGKSTLAWAIAGKENYDVTGGSITYKGKNLLELAPEERASEGIFLGFQYPVEIPGVSMTNFMRTALNEQRKYHGLDPIPAGEFIAKMEEVKKLVEMDSKLANRSVNAGFSGGEKRKMRSFKWLCSTLPLPFLTKQTPD